jgi:hypothetical protein
MPDGDRVHEGLAWIYQKPYMQICDGQFGSEVLANDLVLALWKDVRKNGDKLLPFIQQTAEQCSRIQSNRLFEAIDWQQEIDRVEELKRRMYVDRRMRNLAEDACKEQLRELRLGISSSKFYVNLLAKYMWNVCHANFWERIPLTPSQYQGVSPEYIYERLEEMRPFIHSRILQYAEQIEHHGTFHIPRQPPRHFGDTGDVTIDTNVFTIGTKEARGVPAGLHIHV